MVAGAGVAAISSSRHAYELVRSHGEAGTTVEHSEPARTEVLSHTGPCLVNLDGTGAHLHRMNALLRFFTKEL